MAAHRTDGALRCRRVHNSRAAVQEISHSGSSHASSPNSPADIIANQAFFNLPQTGSIKVGARNLQRGADTLFLRGPEVGNTFGSVGMFVIPTHKPGGVPAALGAEDMLPAPNLTPEELAAFVNPIGLQFDAHRKAVGWESASSSGETRWGARPTPDSESGVAATVLTRIWALQLPLFVDCRRSFTSLKELRHHSASAFAAQLPAAFRLSEARPHSHNRLYRLITTQPATLSFWDRFSKRSI